MGAEQNLQQVSDLTVSPKRTSRMNITNATKNQHYVSQAELRLNSCNPNAKLQNRKIHAFDIIDREQYKITLCAKNGSPVRSNLSLDDLFSFDVVDGKIRANFESLFNAYEARIEGHSHSLLSKLQVGNSDVSEDLLYLFTSKLLNSFRNPHCIQKTINTIGTLANYYPLDTELADVCARIEAGRRPQQEHLCSQLEITDQLYMQWLKTLFMLLMRPRSHEPNILESLVKSIYDNESLHLAAFIFTYTGEHADKRPLLSDRSFSSPIADDSCLAYSFNLCGHAFISYAFTHLEKQSFLKVPERMVQIFKKSQKQINVSIINNDLIALTSYNKNTIYQSKCKVYCSSSLVYGANVRTAKTAQPPL